MVVGNGLLATAFKDYKFDKNFIIFASGVSNSKEERMSEYERDFNLLQNTAINFPNKKFVYFSTCSIFSKKHSKYIEHKKRIETFFCNNVENFLILRLPNVVGRANNRHQLIEYFYERLIKKLPIRINESVSRYLIDVEDMVHILKAVEHYNKRIFNVAFNNPIKVADIIEILQHVTNKKFVSIEKYKDSADSYEIDNSDFIKNIQDTTAFNTVPQYIISKYYES